MSAESHHKPDLTIKILIAMFVGLLLGAGLYELNLSNESTKAFTDTYLVNGVFLVLGKLFINALKMMVVPLVLVSLVCGVCASSGGKDIGRIGGKTFGLYFVTTAIAISLALLFATLIDPGAGADLGSSAEYAVKEPPTITQVLIALVPTNPIQAMAEGQMLQIIVFAIALGLAIKHLPAVEERIVPLFNDLNEVIMMMVMLIMKLAPIGVFCLVAKVFAEKGIGFFGDLWLYVLTVIVVLFLHAAGTFTTLLLLFAKVNPITFVSKLWPSILCAFSTASSAATMPLTLRIAEKRMGIKNEVASFTIPMGTTINMDGTAIMQGVATVFIAAAYNIDLTAADFLTVILTATLASVGTAAVPGAGMITLAMVLQQVGLPAEAIGLIIGVDRILDMIRTAVNVTGDATVTTVVAVTEGKLDRARFDDPDAGLDEDD